MLPWAVPETVAVKSTPFNGAVPELGLADNRTVKIEDWVLAEMTFDNPDQFDASSAVLTAK